MPSAAPRSRRPDSPGGRLLSALELLFGAFLVVGHNVFHLVPNEVPILFVLGLVSIRWRDGSFAAMGLYRPASWGRIVLIALAAAAHPGARLHRHLRRGCGVLRLGLLSPGPR